MYALFRYEPVAPASHGQLVTCLEAPDPQLSPSWRLMTSAPPARRTHCAMGPQWMDDFMENLINMDDNWVSPCWETSIWPVSTKVCLARINSLHCRIFRVIWTAKGHEDDVKALYLVCNTHALQQPAAYLEDQASMAAVGQSALQMVDAVFEALWCYLRVSTCPLSPVVIHFDSLMDIHNLQKMYIYIYITYVCVFFYCYYHYKLYTYILYIFQQ